MTQDQLNNLYKRYEGMDDYDKAIKLYYTNLTRRGARLIECDWKEHGDVIKEFIALLEVTGAIVLSDPNMDGTDCYGWVIFLKGKNEKR